MSFFNATALRYTFNLAVIMALGLLGIVVYLVLQIHADPPPPMAQTDLGSVIGSWRKSDAGQRYAAFEGIPYALPPIGDLRFENPIPWVKWPNSTLIANKLQDHCIEYNLEVYDGSRDPVSGSEDCLHLNVYVPELRKNETGLPVLFWIHDGAFQYGHPMPDAARYLMDHNVIYVSFSYRLGALGFISTGDDVISGNMGLKDQVIALKWVNKHIHSFGGDPKKITLVGLSAGGASVHYHYLSPLSKGLFSAGISASGTALMPWSQTENSREKTNMLALALGCPVKDTWALMFCLKKTNAYDIVRAQKQFMPWRLNPFTPFGPVIEKYIQKPFLDNHPMEIIRNGKSADIPWIVGLVSSEGLYPAAAYYNEEAMAEINSNWTGVAPYLLDFFYTVPKEKHADIANNIRRHYLGDEPLTFKNFHKFVEMVGDRLFNVDAERAALAQASTTTSSVWFYYYTYRAKMSLGTDPSNSTDDLGVCHGDDVYLVLGNDFMKPKGDQDHQMVNDIIGMWKTLAEKGYAKIGPTHMEKVASKPGKRLNYLRIDGPNDFTMVQDDNFAQKEFWLKAMEYEYRWM